MIYSSNYISFYYGGNLCYINNVRTVRIIYIIWRYKSNYKLDALLNKY